MGPKTAFLVSSQGRTILLAGGPHFECQGPRIQDGRWRGVLERERALETETWVLICKLATH